MKHCTAKSKRTGKRCRANPVSGQKVCYHHGGKSPAGPASPHFQTGRYSKLLPAHLSATYQAALSDPDLLALKDELALLDSRLAEVVHKLAEDDSPENRRRLRAAWAVYKAAHEAQDWTTAHQAFDAFDELIEQGPSEYGVWNEIRSLIDDRRKLVESERRRLVETQSMITADRAMVLLAVVVDTVRRHVTDRKALAAISADIGALVAGEALPAARAG